MNEYITVKTTKKTCKEKFELQQTYFQRNEVFLCPLFFDIEVDGVESLPDISCIITLYYRFSISHEIVFEC